MRIERVFNYFKTRAEADLRVYKLAGRVTFALGVTAGQLLAADAISAYVLSIPTAQFSQSGRITSEGQVVDFSCIRTFGGLGICASDEKDAESIAFRMYLAEPFKPLITYDQIPLTINRP